MARKRRHEEMAQTQRQPSALRLPVELILQIASFALSRTSDYSEQTALGLASISDTLRDHVRTIVTQHQKLLDNKFKFDDWEDAPNAIHDDTEDVAAAIHAAEHALISLMPQFVVSMPGDVRTECKNALKEFAKKESQRKRPARLTFYDSKGGAGGSGIAAKAFEFADMLLERAVERVAACHCMDGCLECVCDERCKEQNQVTSKAGAEVVLKCLLGRKGDIDIDALPWGEDDRVSAGIETVIAAEPIKVREGVVEQDPVERVVVKAEPIDW